MQPTRFLPPLDPVNYAIKRCPTSRGEASQRILIVRTQALGGVVMMTPLIGALRQAYPNAYISWMVEPQNAQAVDANPYVDELIVWPQAAWGSLFSSRPRNWLKNAFGLRPLVASLSMAAAMRGRRFDTLITFQLQLTPLLLHWDHPARSVAVFDRFSMSERGNEARRYTRAILPDELPLRQPAQMRLILDALQVPEPSSLRADFGYTLEDVSAARDLIADAGIRSRFIILSPTTTWATKTWSEQRWAELGERLAALTGFAIAFTGAPGDRNVIERIMAEMRAPGSNLAGKLTIRQLGALIDLAALTISHDSAVMHIAAALGTPSIAVFGATNPQRYAPLEGQVNAVARPVPCGPCDSMVCRNPERDKLLCLRLVDVDTVLQTACRLLALNVDHFIDAKPLAV